MDLNSILMGLANQAWSIVAGSLVTVFVGGVALWTYKTLGAPKLVQEEPARVINELGILVSKGLKYIKDENFKNELIKDLDSSGDKFNDAWDKGIRGIRL